MTKPTSDQINFQNSVVLPQSLTVDGTTLVVDGTNNRVGINTASPAQALDVTGNAAVSGNLTAGGDLAVNGADITTTATGTATVFNANATTLNVGGAATTVALGAAAGTVSVGNLSMNAGYGSITSVFGCRLWVNWNGLAASKTTTNPFGGTCSATRASGSTTCTITTTQPHGMLTGHIVMAATTTLETPAIAYLITVTGTNTFTVQTTATSPLSSAAITFHWAPIRASGNVHSVANRGTGTYTVNFASAMPDLNYLPIPFGNDGNNDATFRGGNVGDAANIRTTSCLVFGKGVNSTNQSIEDHTYMGLAIIR